MKTSQKFNVNYLIVFVICAFCVYIAIHFCQQDADSVLRSAAAPQLDFSGIKPDQESFILSPPSIQEGKEIGPWASITQPNGQVKTMKLFEDSKTMFQNACFPIKEGKVNGKSVGSYTGWTWSNTICGGRRYAVSNASDRIYQIRDNGQWSILSTRLPGTGVPSDIHCAPDGSLVVSVLPGVVQPNSLPLPATLARVQLDGKSDVIAKLPMVPDLPKQHALCKSFLPGVEVATDVKLLITQKPDGSFVVLDSSIRKLYSISLDGKVSEYADVPTP